MWTMDQTYERQKNDGEHGVQPPEQSKKLAMKNRLVFFSNDERSCWSREDLLKTRIFLKQEVSEEVAMFPPEGVEQNSDAQDAAVQRQQ